MSKVNVGLNASLQNVKNIALEAPSVKTEKTAIPIGKRKPEEIELCKNLGISIEEFDNIVKNNPEFKSLSFNDQTLYIQKMKITAEPLKEVNPETDIENKSTDVSAETIAETANENKETVIEDNSNETVSNKLFKDLGDGKYDKYTEELAKNNFLFTDKSSNLTEKDWNALPKDEKQKLINEASAKVQKENLKELSENEEAMNVWLDSSYSDLMAANSVKLSLDKYNELPEGKRDEYFHDYMFGIDPKDRSKIDQIRFDEINLVCETANYTAKQNGIEDANYCPDEAKEYLDSLKKADKDFNPLRAQYDYLKNAVEDGQTVRGEEITEYHKEKYKNLSEIVELDRDGDLSFGRRIGDVSKLKLELTASDEFSTAFKNSKNNTEKGLLLEEFLHKQYGNTPDYADKVEAFRNDAIECGEIELASALGVIAKNDKTIQSTFANSTNLASIEQNSYEINIFDKENAAIAAKNMENCENAEVAEQALLRSTELADDEHKMSVAETSAGSKYQSVQKSTYIMGAKSKNIDVARGVYTQSLVKSSQETKDYIAANADLAQKELQLDVLQDFTKDSPSAIKAAINNKTITRLDKENQTNGLKIIHNENEKLPDDIALENSLALADQIELCDKDNQLDMHNTILNSKFEKVLERASSNIHKYDESVQANAIKSSFNTGNEKAIEAVVAQLDKCAPSAIQATAAESAPYIAAIENKYSNKVGGMVADYQISEYNKYSNPAENKDELKENYIKEFLAASSQEQYKMLSKLPETLQGSALTLICRYCPNMLAGLVKQGYGKQILKTPGMSSEVIYKVVNVMFESRDGDKVEAAKYVSDHKTLFSKITTERADGIIEYAAVDKNKKSNNKEYASLPEFFKSALKPKMSDIYPDAEKLFFNS